MRRRELLALVAGAAALRPLAGKAQPPERMRRVGVLMAFPENDPVTRAGITALVHGLEPLGWVEGKNIRIDYRFAAGNPALFKKYAAELVAMSPDVILASTPPGVAAVEQLTRTIPIVFVLVLDPVGQGFVKILARPGGNITGFSSLDTAVIMGKWLQLLKEAVPGLGHVAVMYNPDIAATYAPLMNRAITAAAPSLAVRVRLVPVRNAGAIEQAIAAAAREPGGGVICLPDPFNVSHRNVIIASATRHRLPLISVDFFARSGGLMSYWFDPVALYGQAAPYIDRILRGADPAGLPIQNPSKFLLIINLTAAKALGLKVPQSLLAQADEVIR